MSTKASTSNSSSRVAVGGGDANDVDDAILHSTNHQLKKDKKPKTNDDDDMNVTDLEKELPVVSQRRGSVESELAEHVAAEAAADETNVDAAIADRTTSIRITRAASPVGTDGADIDSALLNTPLDPSAYRSKQPPCSSGLTVGDFELLKVVGRGAYGKVYLCQRKSTGRYYAMKVVRKSDAIRKNVVVNMRSERDVLEAVRHPFIVNLRFAFQSDSKLYLVLDFISGGELFSRLNASRDNALPVKDCRFYAAEVVLALEHLHKLNIIYRDLKPENLMLDSSGHIVLCDFGFAKEHITSSDSGSRSFCGTLAYMSPELITSTGHGKGSDWWALGCLLFEMLTGMTPFQGPNRKILQDNICNGPLKLPKYLDAPTKSIITELLRRPIHKRLGCGPNGAADIKKHNFFIGIDWIALSKRLVTPPFLPKLASQQDTCHFDVKFTSERPVDTPLSPTMMATILHDQGTSPSTFHSAEEAFANFSYARDHTPAPSPALRPTTQPSSQHGQLPDHHLGFGVGGVVGRTRNGSSTSSMTMIGSPRPLTGLPPMHPEILELPATSGSNHTVRSLSSRATANTTVTSLAATSVAASSSSSSGSSITVPASSTVLGTARSLTGIASSSNVNGGVSTNLDAPSLLTTVSSAPPAATTTTTSSSSASTNTNTATVTNTSSSSNSHVKKPKPMKPQHTATTTTTTTTSHTQPQTTARGGAPQAANQTPNAKPNNPDNRNGHTAAATQQTRPGSAAPAATVAPSNSTSSSASPSCPPGVRMLGGVTPVSSSSSSTLGRGKPLSAKASVFVPGGGSGGGFKITTPTLTSSPPSSSQATPTTMSNRNPLSSSTINPPSSVASASSSVPAQPITAVTAAPVVKSKKPRPTQNGPITPNPTPVIQHQSDSNISNVTNPSSTITSSSSSSSANTTIPSARKIGWAGAPAATTTTANINQPTTPASTATSTSAPVPATNAASAPTVTSSTTNNPLGSARWGVKSAQVAAVKPASNQTQPQQQATPTFKTPAMAMPPPAAKTAWSLNDFPSL